MGCGVNADFRGGIGGRTLSGARLGPSHRDRQWYGSRFGGCGRNRGRRRVAQPRHKLGSVSYTHLDVYKRQVQNKNAEGSALAIRSLEDAIFHGATNPADFEELAELLVAAHRQTEAVNVLRQGMQLDPHSAELYRLSVTTYFALNKMQEACEVVAKGTKRFPQDDAIRALMNRCDAASGGVSK